MFICQRVRKGVDHGLMSGHVCLAVLLNLVLVLKLLFSNIAKKTGILSLAAVKEY